MFDGLNLTNPVIRFNVKEHLTRCCNSKKFPAHLKEGRLVLLSKSASEIAEISNTRPIVVLSHLSKITEKMIVNKLNSIESKLLDTGDYQTGFKKKSMTHFNLTKVFKSIDETR